MEHILEVDFSQEIKASREVKCDNCGKVLGESYPKGRSAIAVTLPTGQDQEGYDNYKEHHYCGEGCLTTHLNTRAASKK